MIFESSNIKQIAESIDSQPQKLIRLVSGDNDVSGFNSGKVTKMEFFESKIKPFLESKTTPAGRYTIEGKVNHQAKPLKMLEINKPNENGAIVMSSPVLSEADLKNKANGSLIEQNADFRYKVQYLEKQVIELQKIIEDLTDENTRLLEEAEELEEVAEEKPILSETQQLAVEFVRPLMPGLQAFAMSFLNKYLESDQPQQFIQPTPENPKPHG